MTDGEFFAFQDTRVFGRKDWTALCATEPQVLLAKKIASITPDGALTKSFFTNSGGIPLAHASNTRTRRGAPCDEAGTIDRERAVWCHGRR